jgi:hypothetical protein
MAIMWVPMHMMQVTIMEVIHVGMMAHSRVSAARTMLVSVIRMMLLVGEGHGLLLNLRGLGRQAGES